MIKKYLVTSFKKIKLPKKTQIIFENEYLKKLYRDRQLSGYKCFSIESLSQVYLKKDNRFFCKKKTERYLKEIFPILNRLNNSKLKKKEWEYLIEYFLLISISNIKRRFDTLKKIKDKENTFIYADNYNFFFEDTSIYKIFQFEDAKFNSYVNYLISKRLNFKILKSNKIKKVFLFKKPKKKTLIKKIIYFIYDNLLNRLKPIIIFDGYFGKKNSLKVTLKSKFKILFANIDYFDLPFNLIIFKKNIKYRSKISIKIKDDFDIIYNEFLKNVLPSSFLENFNNYLFTNKSKCSNISKIGTAIHFAEDDNFKFAVLNLKKQNKKTFNLQHGAYQGQRIFTPEDYINQKMSNLNLLWHNKKLNIGSQYFSEFKQKLKKFENKILFFPCHTLFNQELENLTNNNHIYLNQLLKLLKLLINKKKFFLSIKFFNHQNDEYMKKIWKDHFGQSVKILDSSISYKGSIFQEFDLVIVDDFSTAFYELMYLKKPFIVINSAPNVNFKKSFWNTLNGLKKINLWFNDEKQLSKYLQNNFENIILNWDNLTSSKYYTKLRKTLFARNNFNDSLFVKNILEL
jgi:putative transferase (TIGR04331 family)